MDRPSPSLAALLQWAGAAAAGVAGILACPGSLSDPAPSDPGPEGHPALAGRRAAVPSPATGDLP